MWVYPLALQASGYIHKNLLLQQVVYLAYTPPNHDLYITYNGRNNAIVCIQEHTYIVVCKFIGYGQFTLTYLEVLSVLINIFCLDITTLCMKSSSSKCKTAVFIFSIKATTCVVCKQYNLLPFLQYVFLNS